MKMESGQYVEYYRKQIYSKTDAQGEGSSSCSSTVNNNIKKRSRNDLYDKKIKKKSRINISDSKSNDGSSNTKVLDDEEDEDEDDSFENETDEAVSFEKETASDLFEYRYQEPINYQRIQRWNEDEEGDYIDNSVQSDDDEGLNGGNYPDTDEDSVW
tara:strand:- start:51 stop:521 length:471 start_codon:yes stop_codon:yes gene_type:complete